MFAYTSMATMKTQSPQLPATLSIDLTPQQEKDIIPQLDLEDEVKVGTREPLPNGRTRLTCQINDQEKYDKVFNFLLRFMAERQQPVSSN
jgi:hypothetical protein